MTPHPVGHMIQKKFCMFFVGYIYVLTMLCVCAKGEKVKLKDKAEEEQAFQEKTSISIPLVDEHSDDVKAAKKISFVSSGSAQERRRKRLEVTTQSVFGSKAAGGETATTKKARALLVAARSKTKGGAFNSPSSGKLPSRTGVVRTERLRNALGIKTLGKM